MLVEMWLPSLNLGEIGALVQIFSRSGIVRFPGFIPSLAVGDCSLSGLHPISRSLSVGHEEHEEERRSRRKAEKTGGINSPAMHSLVRNPPVFSASFVTFVFSFVFFVTYRQ